MALSAELRLSPDYHAFLQSIKQRVHNARQRVAQTVNSELIQHYWSIGHDLIIKREEAQWGTSFFEQLAQDLQVEFPGTKGYSAQRKNHQF